MYTKTAKQTAEFLVKRCYILNITPQSAQFEFIERHIHNDTYDESERGKEVRKMPKVTDTQQAEQRRKFWDQEEEFESQVDYSRLSGAEQLIHMTHAEAVRNGHFTYDDPENGERVFTRLRHFLKGSCCGSACRHCIYNHIKVPEIKKRACLFNTAYWTYDENMEVTAEVTESFNKVKPLIRKKQATTQKLTIEITPTSPNR